jgi:hypothetical protein
MCRARPGPRCSNGGEIRFNRAIKHLKAMQLAHESEASLNEGKVSGERQRITDNAVRRLKAAEKVYFATPKGQLSLEDNENTLSYMLSNMDRGTPFSSARREYRSVERQLKQARQARLEGIQSRKDQYADLHLVKGDVHPGFAQSGERRQARDETRARGGNISRLAQPMTQSDMDATLVADPVGALEVKEWPSEVYDRAKNWVEKGTNTGWAENVYVRPDAAYGERIAPSISRLVRLNTPDGQVVEGRADIHVTKNGAGKYVVSERLTVASSWEDASPIDVTTQNIGHIISARRGVNRRAGDKATEFNTQAEAEAYARRTRHGLNQRFVKDVARQGREAFVGRAHRLHEALQKRGFAVWPRYEAAAA